MTVEGASGNQIARFSIDVPKKLPYGNSRANRWERHRMVAYIREVAEMQFGSTRHERGLPRAAGHRVLRLRLSRGPGQRLLDDDNCLSGVKSFCDSLIKSGWIKDDSRKWLTRHLVEQFRGEKPELFIEIEWEPGS